MSQLSSLHNGLGDIHVISHPEFSYLTSIHLQRNPTNPKFLLINGILSHPASMVKFPGQMWSQCITISLQTYFTEYFMYTNWLHACDYRLFSFVQGNPWNDSQSTPWTWAVRHNTEEYLWHIPACVGKLSGLDRHFHCRIQWARYSTYLRNTECNVHIVQGVWWTCCEGPMCMHRLPPYFSMCSC